MAGSSRCDAQLNNSSSSSTENDLPSSTCDWTKGLIDKLGLRYEYKLPSDMVIEHMSSVAHLFPEEINDLEKVASKLGTVGNLNHESLLQINLAGLRWLTQSDEDVGLLRTEVPFKEIDVLRYSTHVKKFGFSLWFVLKENPFAVYEAKYRCLFQEFLQMFGIQVMAQPVINMESTKLFREKVSSCADIVFLSQRDVEKCAVAVCEVKGECCSADQDEGPTAPKFRRTQDSPEKVPVSKENTSLPDGLLPQHIGQLLIYLHKSICKEALLGMAVDKTCVTFTRLFMEEDTMTEIQTSSRESLPLKEEERPILYYSKPCNYLLEEDRVEIVKALLTLTVMEYRARRKKRR